jgi:hypothetical protein
MTENADLANGASAAPEDSALRPAESDLHPADPADDLTGNTSGGSTVSSDAPAPDAPAPDAPAPDAPAPVAALPGDSVPGDGAVEHDRPDVPDAMRTATTGREAAAARADTSDDRPTPTATPAD